MGYSPQYNMSLKGETSRFWSVLHLILILKWYFKNFFGDIFNIYAHLITAKDTLYFNYPPFLLGLQQMNKPRESLQPGRSLPHHTLMDLLFCSQKSKDEKG